MLALIVVVIVMGFPTAFTLMGLGMFFGFYAFFDPTEPWFDNRVFDLMVQRTYGAMTNDVLISIPLFVLMGYVMERGALVDKMFHSIQLSFRRVPASLAVATLIVCTFWGIASGLVGAVVVLMGVIAMNPMLRAGYDVKLASGVITAGGTLGILIPPSVMIIVYAAVAGQSVVKLYAAAMLPGFFLALLYLIYVLGWATINPKIAPRLPEEQTRVPVPAWMRRFQASYSHNMLTGLVSALFSPGRAMAIETGNGPLTYGILVRNTAAALVPLALTSTLLALVWWYVAIYQQAGVEAAAPAGLEQLGAPAPDQLGAPAPKQTGAPEQLGAPAPEQLGGTGHRAPQHPRAAWRAPEQLGTPGQAETRATDTGPSTSFYVTFSILAAIAAAVLFFYYRRMDAERLQIVKLLASSIMPLGLLTVIVLGVILFGITTATESAAVGAAGAFLLAFQARTLDWKRTKEAVFLTAKTTAMVCWLFVGSALFSAVFAILGGQALVEQWVLSLNLARCSS